MVGCELILEEIIIQCGDTFNGKLYLCDDCINCETKQEKPTLKK